MRLLHRYSKSNITPIKYGALYNGHIVKDSRYITNDGWHIPDYTEYEILFQFCGGTKVTNGEYVYYTIAGKKLSATGDVFWSTDSIYGTNDFKFNLYGNGHRTWLPSFNYIKRGSFHWTSTEYLSGLSSYFVNRSGSSEDIIFNTESNRSGLGLRPIKNFTTLTNGQTGRYIGNDGKIYRTICIGTQEWLADNLAETKYRDGSDIPIITSNSIWPTLTTGAMCYYNNNPAYM